MFFSIGREPGFFAVRRLLWLPVAVLFTGAAQAQPLALADAEALALAGEPGRAALLARAEASRERAVAAAQLPDPMVRVGLMNYPLEGGGFSAEAMTQAQIGVRQAFPPGRAQRRQHLELKASALSEDADARARQVLHGVRRSWLDVWHAVRARETVEQMRPLFDDLAGITTSLYSVGRKDQQDVLRMDLEVSRLSDRIIELTRMESDARGALAEWVGPDADRPLPAALPPWPAPPPMEVLRERLAAHPSVRAAVAQVAAGDAAVAAAREQARPGWALDVAYGYRDGRLPSGASRSDFVSVGVSLDLPLFRANRQDRQIAAAIRDKHAAGASRDVLLKRLHAQLRREHARWQAAADRLRLYDTTVLPATRAHAEAAMAAYQSDAGDFADVMRSVVADLNARLDHLRAQADRAQAWAALAELGGLEP